MKSPPQPAGIFLLLFILFTIIPLQISAQKHSEVSVYPFRESPLHMTPKEPKFYRLDLSNMSPDFDLSISVLPEGRSSTSPKLFVSKEKEYPRSQADSEYSSVKNTGNVIFISAEDLKGAKQLYVGLQCIHARCITNVVIEWVKEIKAIANGEKAFESSNSLNGASSAVVRLTVPKDNDVERIVIHVDAITSSKNELPSLEVFINQGMTIPYTNNAETIPRSSWFEGNTLIISKNSNIFCTDCTYTLSLKFKEFSSVSVQAQTYKKNTEIYGTTALDGVQKDMYNAYSFKIRETHKEEDFVLSVKIQQGKVKVYINCDKQPESFASYYWNYLVENSEEIILTKKEHSKCSTEDYYFLVYGEESSVYSLRAAYKKSNRLFMGTTTPVTGDIFPGEKITYEVLMPIFAAEEIVINLRFKQGSPLGLNIINCRFATDCPGILPADSKFQISNAYGFDKDEASFNEFSYQKDQFSEAILAKINPHENGCFPILVQDQAYMNEPLPVCAYLVTISSEQGSPVEYTLTAFSKGHNWLFINTPKFDSVQKNAMIYYVLYVPHQNVESIQIQVTEFSGDIDIFVSKSNKYPNKQDPTDSLFSHEGFMVLKDLPDMSGAYYIGVIGVETSSFSISAIVKTKSGMNEDYALTLDQGKPQKGVLLPKHEHPAQFYKFLLNQDNEWKGTLRITANSLRGRLILAVNNNGEIPTPNLQQWKSKGHDLEISSDDPNFKKQGLYHIGVFVDWTDQDAKFLSDITYNIAFYIKDGGSDVQTFPAVHMFLSPNTPFYGVIQRGTVDYFEALFLVDDNSVTIYKQADSGDVDLFISIDPKNKFPSKDSYSYTTKDQHKNSITLTADDRRKACETTTSLACSIYIAVLPSNTQQEETYYSLSIKRETTSSSKDSSVANAAVALEDGRQIQSSIPASSQTPAIFYYYAVPSQHSVVTVTCPGREITIFADRIKMSIGSQTKPNIVALDEKTSEISSIDNQGHQLGVAYVSIPPVFVETGTVVVALSVYFKDPQTAGLPSKSNDNQQTTFTILASSQITHLFTGYPYFGFVPKEKYQYFYVNVMRAQCTLLITMTTLDDGDPDLVISYGSNTRPTLSDHQFASISKQRTEIIEINNNDIYPLDSMSGHWIIGVYGRTASSFTLTAVYEDQKMVDLKPGTPFEMFLKESSSMNFKFFHEFKSNVNVKLDQFSGNVDLYVTSIDPKDDLASNLPNATSHKWKISGLSAQSSINIPQQDQKSCFSCLYIINVQSQASSKFSLLVTEGDGIQQIQDGLRYTGQLKPQEKAYYVMTSSNSEEARLNVYMKGIELNIMASQNPTLNTSHYLWRETLTPNWPDKSVYLKKMAINDPYYSKPVWDGKRDISSQRNSFYILLYNPTNFDVEYGFTMTTKESNIILMEGSKQSASIDPYESVSFLYYSPTANLQLKLSVEYIVSVPTGESEYLEHSLRQGLQVKGRYWSERTTAGMGEVVYLEKGPVVDDKSTSRDKETNTFDLRQTFTLKSQKGKYGFEIENPWRFKTEISIRVYSTATELLTLDQNSQHYGLLTPGETEKYEVFMGTSGKWYVWVFACTGNVNLNIEDGDTGEISKTPISIPRGKDHLYKATIPNEGMSNRVKYVSVSSPQEQSNTGFFISTSLINEQEFHDYELRDNHLYMVPSYEYGDRSNKVIVRLQPVEFRGGEATDKVRYHVRLCPYIADRLEEMNDFCQLKEECRHYSEEFFMNSQKTVNAKFESVPDGEYYVQSLAVVVHQTQMIKFVPFDTQTLSVVQPIGHKVTSNFWKILGGLALLVIVLVVCVKGFKKVKEFSEDRGFELEMFSKKKGYDMLGES